MPECNGCTMCCKVMGVPELKKMPTEWCKYCMVGHGCSIYSSRPPSCVEFKCLYRMASKLSLELRPDKCKVVIAPTTNPNVISANVDPGYPDAWQKEPIYSVLKNIAEDGNIVVINTELGIKKIVLKRMADGIVSKVTIEMSPPDENGMQWYGDEQRKEAMNR